MHTTIKRIIFAVVLALCLGLTLNSWAATINVADGAVVVDPNDKKCSLREAIINANDGAQTHSDCAAGSPASCPDNPGGTDTIVLATGSTYTITDVYGSPSDPTGLPTFDTTIVIEGNGATIQRDPTYECTSITADPKFRIFYFDRGTDCEVTPNVYEITGSLTLNNVTVKNGCISGYGGGIFCDNAELILDNSIVSYNAALGSAAYGGEGGGIFDSGGPEIKNSTITHNWSSIAGGGMYWGMSYMKINNSTFSYNRAPKGGGLYVAAGSVAINNSTFSYNDATGYDCYSSDYDCGGGAILFENGSGGTITDSYIDNNTSNTRGGGISNSSSDDSDIAILRSAINDNSANYGGGLYTTDPATVTDSTFSGNSAYSGGGIFAIDEAVMTITNSTISNNTATSSYGGGISVSDAGYYDSPAITIINSTISNNTAQDDGGGIYINDSGFGYASDVKFKGTIVAGNTDNNTTTTFSPDCYHPVGLLYLTSQGYNLVGNNSGCVFTSPGSDQVGTPSSPIDPKLGSLADNGGPTYTHALLPSSPAIDTGVGRADCPAQDQRGFTRPEDGDIDGTAFCDTGAYEARRNELLVTIVAGNGTVTSDPNTPEGIDCPTTTCFARFTELTLVTLTAVPDANYVFGNWTGCDSTSGNECTCNMTANEENVTVTFVGSDQATQDLIDTVVPSYGLPEGTEKSLLSQLEAALKSINKSKTNTAIMQLQSFINYVNALIKTGQISSTDGQDLIDAANAIIAALGG